MRPVLAISRALADPTRLRALMALRGGELCLCQLVSLFGLAPSTISRHMNVLFEAGLVERRKEGRWAYFRLAGRGADPAVRAAIRWVADGLGADEAVARDAAALRKISARDLSELCGCYA